jgi:hypothetical protein
MPMSADETDFSRLSARSRATSWNGASITKSTSPEASAASRVASAWITV